MHDSARCMREDFKLLVNMTAEETSHEGCVCVFLLYGLYSVNYKNGTILIIENHKLFNCWIHSGDCNQNPIMF